MFICIWHCFNCWGVVRFRVMVGFYTHINKTLMVKRSGWYSISPGNGSDLWTTRETYFGFNLHVFVFKLATIYKLVFLCFMTVQHCLWASCLSTACRLWIKWIINQQIQQSMKLNNNKQKLHLQRWHAAPAWQEKVRAINWVIVIPGPIIISTHFPDPRHPPRSVGQTRIITTVSV